MKRFKIILSVMFFVVTACSQQSNPELHEHAAHEEIEKGIHGGRLLGDGEFSVEVTIFERGTPPEFRLFATANGKQVPANEVSYTIELKRFGNKVESFDFTSRGDYAVSNRAVEEPHSFDVTVSARFKQSLHTWTYESYEGRTTIDSTMAKNAGVEIATLGPGTLKEFVALHGVIEADPSRLRSIAARFPGVIQSVNVQVGEAVRAGTALAVIESNESLQNYSVTAPISGIVTMRHANVGEAAGHEPIFEIADYSTVRAELSVFPRDYSRLKKGQEVVVRSADGKQRATGTINYLATTGEKNQSLAAHVVIDNKQGLWTPGLFVDAEVTVSSRSIPLALPITALQKFRNWDVLFLNDGEIYQAMPLELGDNDGVTTEVKSGAAAGDRYVVTNSYLIKADIEKAGASHDH